MNNATKEYIEFFGFYDQIEKMLDDLFKILSESLTDDEIDYFRRLRAGFDMSGLLSAFGASLESKFSTNELNEIIRLYRENPVLMKSMHVRDELYLLQQEAGRNMVSDAAMRMPYLVMDSSVDGAYRN